MTGFQSITLRPSGPTDMGALDRLAQLDSQRLPVDDFLLAEVGGQPVAALGMDSGTVVADPFRRTAAVTELLRLSAAQRRSGCRPGRRPPLRIPLPALARPAAGQRQVACA